MFANIQDTLNRQDKALDLMKELLQEEFSLLMKRDTDAVMTIEFSIHELLRQLANGKRKHYPSPWRRAFKRLRPNASRRQKGNHSLPLAQH